MSWAIQIGASVSQPKIFLATIAFFVSATIFPQQTRADENDATPAQIEFFERKVRPLFAEHCYSCHSVNADSIQAGLLMDSRAALLQGGDSGEAIIPGDPDASLLIQAVRYESYEMPPKGKLPAEDIETLQRWVEMHAPWPTETAPTATTARVEFDLQQRQKEHWVWRGIEDPTVPQTLDPTWARHPLDNFVLHRLENAQLHPAQDADRTALMRRLYYDLIGLPPTPVQAKKFLSNTSPEAIPVLVDELLASPHFGERWGRHWLDLVRYAESRGHEFDSDAPNAFQYRDYIIRALNADVPYDQIVREHLAGDLLPDPRLNEETHFNESILGTGFWYLGEWVHSPVDIRKDESDRFDNMIDVMSKTFLGVTVSCARCHDHKFDAISTADYYSLSGFLQSSDYRQVRFESIQQNQRVADQLAHIDAQYQQQINDLLKVAGLTLPSAPDQLADQEIIVDYSQSRQPSFIQDGFIFGKSPHRAGQPYFVFNDPSRVKIAPHGAAAADSFWNGLKSITQGKIQNKSLLTKLRRSGRTLRTKTFELKQASVSCLVEGAGHIVACVDSHRLVAGSLHKQTIKPIKAGTTGWVRLNLDRYVGHRLHLEFIPAVDTRLEVRMVVQGLNSKQRGEIVRRLNEKNHKINQYAQAAEALLNDGENREVAKVIQAWRRQREELSTQVVRESKLALAMLDGTGEDDRILIRGNSSKPGETEPRHFLTAVSGDQPLAIKDGSGRLELANEINSPKNPLAARVIVNRIWHHLMGRGIVPTTDDFGVLGQRPTHPELLDYLASRFIENHRSIKQMIRTIVLSRTYQMSSRFDSTALEADPKNLLWHHRPPKRLEGEIIRDALLSISGRLNDRLFGPSVPIHLTAFMDGRGRPAKNGPLDGDGRRSIYTSIRRNFLSPFMTTFDSPTPFSTMGRRNVSNVPAQALILMNDPLVIELAQHWAKRAINENSTVQSRINWMYQTAFARQPTPSESEITTKYLNSGTQKNGQQLWIDCAHALINTKEFIFLR